MDAGLGFERRMNRGEPADDEVGDHDVQMLDDVKSHRTMMWRPRPRDAARPRILGAIFTAVSAAVRNIGKVKLGRPPRMADFASWVTAAEPGLGWNDREFLAAYSANEYDVSESAFEADAVAVAIADFVGSLHPAPAGWEGTATDLLNAIKCGPC
jgi:hypothetical protein